MAVDIRVATLHRMLLLDCKPVFLAKKRRVIIIIRGDCKNRVNEAGIAHFTRGDIFEKGFCNYLILQKNGGRAFG